MSEPLPEDTIEPGREPLPFDAEAQQDDEDMS